MKNSTNQSLLYSIVLLNKKLTEKKVHSLPRVCLDVDTLFFYIQSLCLMFMIAENVDDVDHILLL